MRIVMLFAAALALAPAAAMSQADPAAPAAKHPPCTQRHHGPLKLDMCSDVATMLQFTVAVDGSVKNVTVAQSSGDPTLDSAAQTCAAGWTYKPAIKDGQPVEVAWKTRVLWHSKNADCKTPADSK